MKITLDVLVVWPIGTKYIDYATKRETTIKGFRVSADTFTEKATQIVDTTKVNRNYITESYNGVQTVINFETPASRIWRSIHAADKVKTQ